MDKKGDPRLAALTGEAIKLMADAGASAEVLGHFAVHYPAIVAAKLEPLPPAPLQDIPAIVRATVEELLSSGLGTQLLKGSPADDRARGERGVPRVKKNVQVGGKRTTIKVRSTLYDKVLEIQPAEAADKLIQTFANAAPADHPNRSAFVEEQLTHFMVMSKVQSAAAGQH